MRTMLKCLGLKSLGMGLAAGMVTIAAASAAAAGSEVEIKIKGVSDAGGTLYVSLQTQDQFMQNAGTYGQRIPNPEAGTLTVTLPDVAPGAYSVSVWHDRENDGVFDREAGGLPKEGWAMLDGDKLQGPPRFEDVSFDVGNRKKKISVDMIYP